MHCHQWLKPSETLTPPVRGDQIRKTWEVLGNLNTKTTSSCLASKHAPAHNELTHLRRSFPKTVEDLCSKSMTIADPCSGLQKEEPCSETERTDPDPDPVPS